MTLATHVTVWAAASLLAGALHLLTARVLNLGFSIFRWGWDSRDLVWKVPLGYLHVFAPVALFLAVLGVVLPARARWRLVIWTWITLVLFSVLLLFPAIHGYASLLLAGGAAVSLSGALAARHAAVL
ncbi:MAG: hypothetical protein ACLGIK_10840, partial [Gemmatimonadota bacterium]